MYKSIFWMFCTYLKFVKPIETLSIHIQMQKVTQHGNFDLMNTSEDKYFRSIAPAKGLDSHLIVCIFLSFFLIPVDVQNIQKILLQHVSASLSPWWRWWQTETTRKMLQKYFLDVLYIAERKKNDQILQWISNFQQSSTYTNNTIVSMWVDTFKKTDQFFWHELVFIGGREGHYFHFLGPTKSLHSHLPVRLLHPNSFLACYVQNIQKILLQHFFHSIYQLPRNYRTKGNDNLLQKYFLDVLYIAIVLIDIDFNSFVLIKWRI